MSIDSISPGSGPTPQNPDEHAKPQDYSQPLAEFQKQLSETHRYDDPNYLTEVASTINALHEKTANAPDENAQILHTILGQGIDVQGKTLSLHQAARTHEDLGAMLAQFDGYPNAKSRLMEELQLLS